MSSTTLLKKVSFVLLTIVLTSGCSSSKKSIATPGTSNEAVGDTRTKDVVSLDEETYLLLEPADDKTYAFTQNNAVKVGGQFTSGVRNERRFLNALLGPNGEAISYYRAGSCCAFKTPNGLDGKTGLLDRYRVTWQGSKDTIDIYINMYDKGDLKIPVGFTARTR